MMKVQKVCCRGIRLATLAGLLACAGCMTYHVSPAKNLSKTEAVVKVNGLLDWVGGWEVDPFV